MPIVAGPAIFDQCLAAHRARTAFSVTIALDATINGIVTKENYNLSFQQPNKVLLVKFVGGQKNMVFWLNGSKFVAYDPPAREMAVRKAPNSGPVVNRLANALGGLQDPIAAQLSPATLAGFFAPFRNLPEWRAEAKGGQIVLTRQTSQGGKPAMTAFVFDARSKLLEKALLVGPKSKLEWRFRYGPAPHDLAFSPPRGTKTVPALSEHAVVDADQHARNVVDESLRAYARLTNLVYTVSSPDGESHDWMSGRSFRERTRDFDWSYTGGVLTVRDFSQGKSFRGKCSSSEVLTRLKTLGKPMDPMLRAYLTHSNPISGWFVPGMKVSSRGTVQVGKVAADAIEMKMDGLEISLLIRRDNHLVASVTSRIDRNGRIVSERTRDFQYANVGSAIPKNVFLLSVTNPLPLTRIARRGG